MRCKSQQTHYAIMTSLLRQNDVIWLNYVKMTLFWRNNDVIITPCVQGVGWTIEGHKTGSLTDIDLLSLRHFFVDPIDVFRHVSVDPWTTRGSTAHTPAHHAWKQDINITRSRYNALDFLCSTLFVQVLCVMWHYTEICDNAARP